MVWISKWFQTKMKRKGIQPTYCLPLECEYEKYETILSAKVNSLAKKIIELVLPMGFHPCNMAKKNTIHHFAELVIRNVRPVYSKYDVTIHLCKYTKIVS